MRSLILGFVLLTAAAANAGSKIEGPLIPHLYCLPDCVATEIKSGKFSIASSKRPGSNGVMLTIKISGARHEGELVNASNIGALFGIRTINGCELVFTGSTFEMVDGRLGMTVDGTTLGIPEGFYAGAPLAICEQLVVYNDTNLIAVPGIAQGHDQDSNP